MKSNTERIKEIADYVITALLAKGVIIQRYDAYSTNSIYLKFDCGLVNSLRIGDHNGKKHLNYMFKVDIHNKAGLVVEKKQFTQYTYGASKKQLDKLIKHILKHRDRRMVSYFHDDLYKEAMKTAFEKGKTQMGFWSQATFIKREVSI